jgi:hypothetical protein
MGEVLIHVTRRNKSEQKVLQFDTILICPFGQMSDQLYRDIARGSNGD